MTLVNHNVISGFILSHIKNFLFLLYICDIMVDQYHVILAFHCLSSGTFFYKVVVVVVPSS